ncbi:hypothetical protein ATCC90586_007128 [Pythium insidiosum]|nr:hypothetical protein ATCC90586_007128 [Pythium insidiosum]
MRQRRRLASNDEKATDDTDDKDGDGADQDYEEDASASTEGGEDEEDVAASTEGGEDEEDVAASTEGGEDEEDAAASTEVNPPQKIHANWDDWEAYFEEYKEATFQVLPRVRATDCPFRFVVQLFYRKGVWQLEVCRGLFRHNHNVSAESYRDYPVARGIKDPVVQAETKAMIRLGAKRSKIYDFLLNAGENVVKRDVDNMIQRERQAVSKMDDDDETAMVVAEFAAHKGNVATVDETDRGETGVESFH